ncbi:cytokine receptor-like factor 2 [Scleropages formosus]|uniref:Uncharacterized LOC108926479 n=1 Tax=Scleropages formosus TaxID=113540 RepID=A0A8C9S875_SCLFO|nr:uncharacterized protein LOC108926479 [Scleropages formosus]
MRRSAGGLQLHVLLLLSRLQATGAAGPLRDINPANIDWRISNTSDSIVVTWGNPNTQIKNSCYESDLQYKRQTDNEWKNAQLKGFFFSLPSPDWRKNYAFRLRMKYACLEKQWSSWTPEKLWKNATFPGPDTPSDVDANFYVLLLLIPLTMFMLYCMFSQKRMRRLLVSQIPDPKHTFDDLLNMEQSQWWPSLENPCGDCVTVELEVVCMEKEEEEEVDKEDTISTEPHPSEQITETLSNGHGDAGGSTCPPTDFNPIREDSPYVYL